jgi:hypothetical protein
MRTLVALVVALAGCHHEASAPAPARARRPRAMAARVPVRDADADRLSALIRAPSSLAHWVRGPVVVLDGETGAVRTECGAGARSLVASVGDAIVDPDRPDPHCQVEIDRVFCEQHGTSDGDRRIGLYFQHDGGWHVTAVIVSKEGHGIGEDAIDRFAARTRDASCPAE